MLRSLLLAILLAACSLTGSQRTFELENVTVVDDSGLVTGATPGAEDPDSADRPLVIRAGGLTRVAVHWTGSSCVREWTLRIGGNRLLVQIEPGGAEEPCDGTQAEHAVTLELNRAVDAGAIEVEQRASP